MIGKVLVDCRRAEQWRKLICERGDTEALAQRYLPNGSLALDEVFNYIEASKTSYRRQNRNGSVCNERLANQG
jgi:hypothetical protein